MPPEFVDTTQIFHQHHFSLLNTAIPDGTGVKGQPFNFINKQKHSRRICYLIGSPSLNDYLLVLLIFPKKYTFLKQI